MSKKNGRGPSVEANSEETLSSGVIVTILPFPARLYDTIQSKTLEKYPDPIPPKKIIKVAGGTEEVDDLSNPSYVEEIKTIKTKREQWSGVKIGSTVLDFCIQVDIKPYEYIIKTLEEIFDEPAPTDLDKRRVYFLTNYALRGRADYERVTSVSLALMAIGDKEIMQRMDSFRRGMAQSENINFETSSLDETKWVDVE